MEGVLAAGVTMATGSWSATWAYSVWPIMRWRVVTINNVTSTADDLK